jgi:hypothetical protein
MEDPLGRLASHTESRRGSAAAASVQTEERSVSIVATRAVLVPRDTALATGGVALFGRGKESVCGK